jgi:hypothetical protein
MSSTADREIWITGTRKLPIQNISTAAAALNDTIKIKTMVKCGGGTPPPAPPTPTTPRKKKIDKKTTFLNMYFL